MHIAEGGIYIGGVNFVNTTTVLPSMVKRLGGSSDLIALMPPLMIIGFLIPPIFTAHLMERLTHFMPTLCITGIIQRIPYLFAGLALIFFVDQPTIGLFALVLTPFLSGIAGGITLSAWQMLLQNTVPPERRASLTAFRFVASCLIGMLAGGIIKAILEKWPGSYGYGILHLICFAHLTISYILFTFIREGSNKASKQELPERIHFRQNLKNIPELLKNNRQLRLFIIMRSFANGSYLIAPFLAIYVLQKTGKDEPFLGELQIWQMVGAISGNILAGMVGDRYGNKWTLCTALSLFMSIALLTPFNDSIAFFYLIFFIFGFSFFSIEASSFALLLDLIPGQKRSTSFAVTALFSAASMIIASFCSSRVWRAHLDLFPLSLLTGLALSISLVALFFIREPRHHSYLSGHER